MSALMLRSIAFQPLKSSLFENSERPNIARSFDWVAGLIQAQTEQVLSP